MKPEELARIKIDKQLNNSGWEIVSREDYNPIYASAVKEALMIGGTESDYLLFVDNRAIAVVEAKKEEDNLGNEVEKQAENYARTPQKWYNTWFDNMIPLVYLANGNKILFKNMLNNPDGDYEEISEMHSPKKMLQLIGKKSEYGALPRLEPKGLRECQYNAEIELEKKLKQGEKKSLAILATGSGKTYLACLAAYRLLNYTSIKRVLFLVDRNNLARQTESEFSLFDKTENQQSMNGLYQINRLKKAEDVNGDIVISTIQKLFSVLTGKNIDDTNEDKEDEELFCNSDKEEPTIDIGNDLKLPQDYFQFIIIDECHRSIYGKWKSVLDYFKDAKILGLTATPTPEAYAYFNNNIVENYTYEDSIVNGVNVPARIYRIKTNLSVHGGVIDEGDKLTEVSRKSHVQNEYENINRIDFTSNQIDRSVIVPNQIRKILETYRDSIYTDLYPDREEKWEYIPKTLIFAKDDYHATQIVDIAKEVFAEKFQNNDIPDNYVQKITYSAGDSNALIRDLRNNKDFRIAVTVTLVATGTDVKPLEVVLFMNDVRSDVLYTQMKGRGCRVISDDKLHEITPNANSKDCFYIVDAVGVTESDKKIPKPDGNGGKQLRPKLEKLLEHLAHGEVTDENLAYLRDDCAMINRRYEYNDLFGHHLDMFINDFGYAPKSLANKINLALENMTFPPYIENGDNQSRNNLISELITNINARKKLLEMYKGYYVITTNDDEVIEKGFTKEYAKSFIENFEKYLNDNKDNIEALRILYNSESVPITYSMLYDLQQRLISENSQYTPYNIWNNYKLIDINGEVEALDLKENLKALTHLIQIVRYAYHKNDKLKSLIKGYSQRFTLYCGQNQRMLTEEQINVMKQIADYIIYDGTLSINELNEIDTELWKKAIINFEVENLKTEIISLSKFLLKVG